MARKLLFNPISNSFDYIDEATSLSELYHVNKFTLNATDIANKSVTLTSTPVTLTLTRLVVIEGIEQDYSVDFTVTGTTLSWNGLGLESLLADGDKIIVIFN